MDDQCPFLLESLIQFYNNTFPFYLHLKVACDFLPLLVLMCFLPFEQVIEHQMAQLQNSTLKCLHHHILFNMFIDGIFKAHQVQILSCFRLGVSVWLTSWLFFLAFQLSSSFFLESFWTWLRLPHPLITNIPQCMCTHPINPMGIHLYIALMAINKQEPMMQFATLLLPLHENLASMWDINNNMRFLQPCSIIFVNKLTWCSRKMTSAP
jgi:hypothetical protein